MDEKKKAIILIYGSRAREVRRVCLKTAGTTASRRRSRRDGYSEGKKEKSGSRWLSDKWLMRNLLSYGKREGESHLSV